MYALRANINKSVFGKILLGIEKVVKTFSIPNKKFSKNGILVKSKLNIINYIKRKRLFFLK